ncbi:winged helix-turn-helix domain-containing protein [Methanonatronarchaeum thermophilum]|uniref:winged helix-turn-helix domain-containing protein n=1 Tax=Methanonatronarchaeum thermophilum TaxID=1927129 RepID=UPI0013747B4C|nr:winged helix-turn-helix domain-containing protein [Methanonatronarchaeum thermophilum]
MLKKDGAATAELIIKKKRLIEKPALDVLDELVDKGVIEKDGKEYVLTDIGNKVAEEVHDLEMD